METITIELDGYAYVLGEPSQRVDHLVASTSDRHNLVLLEARDHRVKVGGLRLTQEQMDQLCKEWMDARRVCPFCYKPGMDVEEDEKPYLESVQTRRVCEHCDGEYDLDLTPGSVPWEDPLERTR